MYVNKCIKCGAEFETKNPKRVICPNCLYAEKGTEENSQSAPEQPLKSYSSYSTEDRPRQYENRRFDNNRNNNRQYNNNRRFDNNRGNRDGQQQRRSFNNNYGGGHNNRYGSQNDNRFNNQRRPNNRFQQGGNRRPKPQPKKQAKPLLVSKEQLEQIELLYKAMLPLPNPDAHETIGAKLELEPRKVFFGINLIRQKLMLPKLPFPKRKLAVTTDQMTAIKSLYTPLLPLPPIGCHKIIAAQLRVDEWRVHVAIKLIRAQMGLDRWNEDRADKPADYMVSKYPKKETAKEDSSDKNADEPKEETKDKKVKKSSKTSDEEPKKRGRKKTEEVAAEESPEEEAPKKRGRKAKKSEDE